MTSLHDIIDSTLQNKDVVMKQLDIGVLRVSGFDYQKNSYKARQPVI